MPPDTWRALTTSRLASLKAYVTQKDYRTTYNALSSRLWGEARERQAGDPSASLQPMSLRVEKVQLFPGWAVRRYADPTKANKEGAEFSLSIYVSGFASSVRSPEAATRSQKAFHRIARGYAALPKLSAGLIPDQIIQTPDFSNPRPKPSVITGEPELAALETHLKQINSLSQVPQDETETDDNVASSSGISDHSASFDLSHYTRLHVSVASTGPDPSLSKSVQPIHHALQKLHDNLDARLQPFWSNSIPNRRVKLFILFPRTGHEPFGAQEPIYKQDTALELVATQDIITDNQGSFQTTFHIPWTTLLTYSSTLHVAFGNPDVEYPVVVLAEMRALPPPPSPSTGLYSPTHHQGSDDSHSHPRMPAANILSIPNSAQSHSQDPQLPCVKSHVTIPLSKFHAPIRLISDIDDTIKHTGVLSGAKNVFQNVFVRQLDELIVHSMVDWYQMLWQRGVSFHYVSNSPFELLPVLEEFFRISSLPQGSVKLKSYAARSLLPAILSPPASRKRQGVVEVLDSFPESRFILVGDSGEQDMELYAELAQERPDQIVGVFIRDVTTRANPDPWSIHGSEETSVLNEKPCAPLLDRGSRTFLSPSATPAEVYAQASDSSTHLSSPVCPSNVALPPYVRSSTMPTATISRLPGLPRRKSSSNLTAEEKRHHELRRRIDRAREDIPQHTAFRVFQEPDECIEAMAILDTWLGSARK